MFNRAKKWAQKNQPIHITGIFSHTWEWINASMYDVIVRNPNYQPSATPANDPVIVAIHGTADRESSFNKLSRRILKSLPSNISHIHRVAFDDRAIGIEIADFVAQLQAKLQLLGYKNIIFWCHSRGGLFAFDYALNHAVADGVNIQAIFAVCSPFGGSGKALPPLTLLSKSISQMQIGSQYLIDLCQKIKLSNLTCFYYAAEKDDIVSVQSACIPEHQHLLTILDRHGHLSILSSHRLVQDFANKLQNLFGQRNVNVLMDSDEESSESSSSLSMSSKS